MVMDPKRPLRRSRNNRVIAGVIGGLAEYIGIDPALARVIYVLVSVFSAAFPGILAYLILLFVMPEE
jgi:phage shock protein C